MKKIEQYGWTNNRSVYNKLRKYHLQGVGKIRCAWCGYNKNENSNKHWYGGFEEDSVKYPSWKIVSKNRKQWMDKPKGYKVTKKVIKRSWRDPYTLYEVIW